MPQQTYQYGQLPDSTDINTLDFSNALPTDQPYPDPSVFDSNNFAYNLNTSLPPYASNATAAPSTELVRRSRNQQLAPQNGQQDQWNGHGTYSGPMNEEDEQDLDVKVRLAKQEAQGKRKQIPPFVQKLSRSVLCTASKQTEMMLTDDIASLTATTPI